MFILRHNGKYVSHHDTEGEALAKLQRIQPHSWEYAFQHGGWTVKEETVVSICLICQKAHIEQAPCE